MHLGVRRCALPPHPLRPGSGWVLKFLFPGIKCFFQGLVGVKPSIFFPGLYVFFPGPTPFFPRIVMVHDRNPGIPMNQAFLSCDNKFYCGLHWWQKVTFHWRVLKAEVMSCQLPAWLNWMTRLSLVNSLVFQCAKGQGSYMYHKANMFVWFQCFLSWT